MKRTVFIIWIYDRTLYFEAKNLAKISHFVDFLYKKLSDNQLHSYVLNCVLGGFM